MNPSIEKIVQLAHEKGASDIHLEPELPIALRVRESLQRLDLSMSSSQMIEMAQGLVESRLQLFLDQLSFDQNNHLMLAKEALTISELIANAPL